MDTNVDKEMQTIIDCFSGGDGGIPFVMFLSLMRSLKKEDTESARELELLVKRFAKLIEIASNPPKEKPNND